MSRRQLRFGRQQSSSQHYGDENRSHFSAPLTENRNNDRAESNSSLPPRKSFLDTIVIRNDEYWQNRVTLTLDVPFTDHSHIIGRGGKNTQAVMKQTACHIHFPDSNKKSDSDKSNQVSIAGPIDKVEIARSRIRGLGPLSIAFELKDMLGTVDIDQLVTGECLEEMFDFAELNIVVRSSRASAQPYCLVRGSVHQASVMVEACETLQDYFFAPETTVMYSTSLEVLPEQQASVIGQDGRHMQWIMQKTGAVVHYPSADDCRRGSSTFYIAGPIDSILEARRHILGLLPVQLTFEVNRENAKMVQPDLSMIEQQLGVSLTVKYRSQVGDCGIKVVSVQAHECNLTNVYAVRSHLMNLTDEITKCADYEFMSEMCAFIPQPTAVMPPLSTPSPMAQPQLAPMLYSGFGPFLMQQNGYNMPMQTITTGYIQQTMPTPLSVLMPTQQYLQPPPYVQPQLIQTPNPQLPLNQWLPPTLTDLSSHSAELGSVVSSERPSQLDLVSYETSVMVPPQSVVGGDGPPLTPKTSAISPNPEDSPIAHSVLSGAKKINELIGIPWRKAPGSERRSLTSDRDEMRMKATLAMNEMSTSGVRTPTEQWAGMYFSNSMPAAVLKAQFESRLLSRHWNNEDENGTADSAGGSALSSVMEEDDENNGAVAPSTLIDWKKASRRLTDFGTTSFLETTTRSMDWNISCFHNPSMVLAALGLSDFHGRFRDQEIDMETFLSLDENNLKDIGVSTVGARKKLLMAIMKLNESAALSGYP